jgi:hypothetical protein
MIISLYNSRLFENTGTELYRERLVKAVARELKVPLLILHSSVLAPSVRGKKYITS